MGSQSDEPDSKSMNAAVRLVQRVALLQSHVSELILVAMTLLIVAEVFCRTFLGISLMFSEEIEGYLLVALVFLGLTVSVQSGSLFRVEFLIRRLDEPAKRVVELIFDLVGFLFAVLLVWQMVRLCMSSYQQRSEAATILATPLYIPQIVMIVGTVSLAFVLITDFFVKLVVIVRGPHA